MQRLYINNHLLHADALLSDLTDVPGFLQNFLKYLFQILLRT
ncbi:hypothetical protein QUF61_04945 [Candidatus Venteria ishoeyi]|nr:hypothetical protein [Candidatus Venteria ishoeyi]MDM8545817.1 hypothetical protein [Candidatus Venteria ishoeyi]